MSTELSFDATSVTPATDFEPVPANWYRLHIVDSERKPTTTGGELLELEFEILDGEYKGRKAWTRLNIVNSSTKAQEIAQRELSAICHATGVMQLSNSAQLHHIPLLARLIVTKEDNYSPRNDIKAYKPVEGTQPVATAAAAPKPATNAPAWAK